MLLGIMSSAKLVLCEMFLKKICCLFVFVLD